jgi:hypothetical protein
MLCGGKYRRRRKKIVEKKPRSSPLQLFPKYCERQSSSLPLLRALGADVPTRMTFFRLADSCAVMSFALARRLIG